MRTGIFISIIALNSWGQQATPLLVHEDPQTQREFQNTYQSINSKPSISKGAGAPNSAPSKVGDIYISTSTSKIYIATGTVTSSSWMIIN